MASRNPEDWMWAQALELMAQAGSMHRQFFRLATTERTRAVWEPPVDVFEDEHEVVVVVALPGVPPDRIDVSVDGGDLLIRAESPSRLSSARPRVHRMEIPYGYFERRVRLPAALLKNATRELINGCLILRLRKTD